MSDEPEDVAEGDLILRCAEVIDLVTEYLDDALDQRDLRLFERHLAICEGCAVYVDQIRMTITLSGTTRHRNVQVMPNNFDELVAALRAGAQD